jgi:uncharacterized protein (TIGR02271 family)
MQHTIAAVYNQQTQAQRAMEDLVASGIPRDDVHLSQSEGEQAQRSTEDKDEGAFSGIRSFFAEVFGSNREQDDVELYSEAVRRGNYVLTVNVPEDELVDRATDVLDRYDPVDIDEQASQWKSGGWAAPQSMRQDSMQTGVTGATGTTGTTRAQSATQNESQAIPVVKEELRVGKRQVQRGGVRIYQRVTEQPVEESVNLREERVVVERNPVDQPASEADLSGMKQGTIELRETAEEPVVEKTARVVEEVRVGKEVSERQEQVRDTVRGTEVEVENLSGQSARAGGQVDDDSYYRTHWQNNFASSGTRYEDYAPAYQYGSRMAASDTYKGKRWDDVESDVRQDWESRNPGSAWQKFKAAIQHGWQRMTS